MHVGKMRGEGVNCCSFVLDVRQNHIPCIKPSLERLGDSKARIALHFWNFIGMKTELMSLGPGDTPPIDPGSLGVCCS